MKRILSIILTVLLLSYSFISAFSVTAVTRKDAEFTLATYAYSASEKKMVATSEFKTGETAYVAVCVSDIEGMGGFAIKLSYDKAAVKKAATDILWLIDDDKSANMIKDNKDNVVITWETYNTVSNLSGLLMYVPFIVLDDYMGTSATFTLEVQEAFENNAAQTTINTKVTGPVSINVVAAGVPQEFLDLVEPLKTITYNPNNNPNYPLDSLAAINKALDKYLTLTGEQKETFFKNYYELYDALTNAKNKYYELASSEAAKLAKEERDAFLAKYGALLERDTNSLTLEKDGEILKNLSADYPLLTSDAKKLLTDYQKDKIVTFINKKSQLEKAEREYQAALEEVADFKAEYDKYVSDEKYPSFLANWPAAYTSFSGYIVGARVYYDVLSDLAKEMLKTEKERLDELYNLSLEYADDAAEEQKILDAVADFIKRYSTAFMVSPASVSIGDKSLIELAIAAYGELEEGPVKERLSLQVENLKKLLTVIEELEKEDAVVTPPATENKPQVEIQKEIVEVEKEVIKTETVTVPGETIVQTETITNTETVTKLVDKITNVQTKWRIAVIILTILLACSICCYVVANKISQKYAVKQLSERMGDDV